MIDKRLSELKAETNYLSHDHVEFEICSLLQIRSLLLQGIDCPVAVSFTPSQPNSRTVLISKEDEFDRSSVKALESASQQCSEVTILNFEALTSKSAYVRSSTPAPSDLCNAGAASSQHLLAARILASTQSGVKRVDNKLTIEATNPEQVM